MSAPPDVAIVGGGPVGLTLACLLAGQGVSCIIYERRTEPAAYSRAIGIHPPALEVMARIGVAEELIRRGICITGGLTFYNDRPIGRLPLANLGGAFPFVLSVPQTVTEATLARRLCELAPGTLRRGVEIVEPPPARYVVACDGKNSAIRRALGITWRGGAYPDAYLMGDFRDDTAFGTDAALFVTEGGIVESFPLPGGSRRWVARLPRRVESGDAALLARVVRERTGCEIAPPTCAWVKPFGIEHYLAQTFRHGNTFLAGDAAHVVSPIGGQGMNLGFLDAADLADTLARLLRGTPAGDYSWRRTRVARTALSRAYLNTLLGRPCPPWHPARALVGAMIYAPPVTRHFARVFTMRDLSPP